MTDRSEAKLRVKIFLIFDAKLRLALLASISSAVVGETKGDNKLAILPAGGELLLLFKFIKKLIQKENVFC